VSTDYGLGIDIGTTFSAAAISTAETTDVFPLGARTATIPSVVVVREHGEVLVGEAAERRALSEPARSAREFKRRLGDPTPIFLAGVPYGAESLTAHVLRAIVEQVVERQGRPPSRIALTHPATYRDYKLDLMRLAVGQADVGEVSFVSEPDAAARYYASQDRLADGDIVAVYDFGGGTFDATVVRKEGDAFELVGSPEGMERIGGIDFDEALLMHVDESLGGALAALDVEDPATRSALARLRDECRQAKEALSSDTDVSIPVALPNLNTEVRVTRSGFEALIRPRVNETIDALGRAVRSAGLGMDDIARVLLVGGTSHIPLVRQLVREATARPVALDAHPKHSVSLGAADFVRPARSTAVAPPSVAMVSPAAMVAQPVAAPPPTATPTLAPPSPAAPGPQPSSRRRLLVPLVVVALLLVGGLGFVLTQGGKGNAQTAASAGTVPVDSTTTSRAATNGAVTASSAVAFGDLGVTIGAPEVDAQDLVVPIELRNQLTLSQLFLGTLHFTLHLESGNQVVGSDRLATQSIPAGGSGHAEVVFPGAANTDAERATLTIDAPGKEPLELVVRDGSTSSSLPHVLAAPGEASFATPTATLSYSVKQAILSFDRTIEEGNAGQAVADRRADLGSTFLSLSLVLKANACECPGGVNWGTSQLHLTIDGTTVAAWTAASGVVQAGATVEFEAGFIVPAGAKQIVLHVGDAASVDPSTNIAIELP
jgi:actin-like ATPase involved in cell morphogenesis